MLMALSRLPRLAILNSRRNHCPIGLKKKKMQHITAEKIVWDMGSHWVLNCDKRGLFEVYKTGPTHSTLVSTYNFSSCPEYSLERAIGRCCQLATLFLVAT
jgi:hypothetical protein